MPISSVLNRRVALPNLDKVMNLPIEGFDDEVRASFTKIMSSNSDVGLKGFSVKQYGVTYTAFYKDDNNNDVCSFNVSFPHGQAYMRRPAGPLRIAEKAHGLKLMIEAMGPDLERDIAWHLQELTKACFLSNAATIDIEPRLSRQLAKTAKPMVHFEVKFPDDDHYEVAPKTEVRAIEWANGNTYKMLDFTSFSAAFIIDEVGNNSPLQGRMTKAEAESALHFVQNYARVKDEKLRNAADSQKLWGQLKAQVENMPSSRSLIL